MGDGAGGRLSLVQLGLDTAPDGPGPSLQQEIGAYEALLLEGKASFKRIA